jgi:nucleoside 2-deoxyribosyltransferase
MKIFFSYRFTGEDPKKLKGTIKDICASLEQTGHKVSCSFWDTENGFFQKNDYTNKQILEYAFQELDTSDAVFIFIKSEEKSEGMLLEVGYALAKGKKLVLAIKKDIQTTFLRELADEVIEFENINQLNTNLRKKHI